MKKIIAIILVLCLALGICACGEKEPTLNDGGTVDTADGNIDTTAGEITSQPENGASGAESDSGEVKENTAGAAAGGADTAASADYGPMVLGTFYRDVVRGVSATDDATVKEVDAAAEARLASIENYPDTVKATGTTYYISANGSDSNSGTSAGSPKKTYESIRGQLKSGDAVLFCRGDIFRGAMKLVSGVSYGAYGSGIKPRFYGSVDAAKSGGGSWKATDTAGVYVFSKIINEYSNIIFNNGQAIGRPVQDMADITERELNVVYKSGKVYLYCPKGNPQDIYSSIEIAEGYVLISGDGTNDNIRIQNLCIMYAGLHGIGSIGNCENLEIEGCVIGYIGGKSLYLGGISIGNGIEIWASCSNVRVHDNYVFQCFDAGITHQSNSGVKQSVNEDDIHYTNNLVEYCVYSFEAFTAGEHNGYTDRMGDVYIENNICRYAGWGWGYLDRPDKGVPCDLKYRAGDHAEPLKINSNIFDRPRQGIAIMGTAPDKSLMIFTNNTVIQDSKRKFMTIAGDNVSMDGNTTAFLNKYFSDISGNKITILN